MKEKALPTIWDRVTYALFLTVVKFYLLLPASLQEWLCVLVGKAVLLLSPKYRKITSANLAIAYPNNTEAQNRELLREHFISLSHLFRDFFTTSRLTPEYVAAEAQIVVSSEDEAILRAEGGKLLVGGHVGPFENLPPTYAHHFDQRFYFVVRRMKHPLIDKWWRANREYWNTETVDREGAARSILSLLRKGKTVGLLFDQNVRASHAVFVDWFGRPAATTGAVAAVALRTKVPVFTAVPFRTPQGTMRLEIERVKVEDLYELPKDQREQATIELTQRCVSQFQRYLEKSPASWFWLHRRWKTVPEEGDLENPYL